MLCGYMYVYVCACEYVCERMLVNTSAVVDFVVLYKDPKKNSELLQYIISNYP